MYSSHLARKIPIILAVTLVTLLSTSRIAVAQDGGGQKGDGTVSGDITVPFGQMISQAVFRTFQMQVGVAPELVTIDPKTHTASVTLTNPSDRDTLEANLSVQDTVPHQTRDTSLASGLIASDSTPAPADSSPHAPPPAHHSLASWKQTLPKKVSLKPGETHTITVHFTVPSHLAAGDYTGYLVVETVVLTDISNGGKPMTTPQGKTVRMTQPHVEHIQFEIPPKSAQLLYRAGKS